MNGCRLYSLLAIAFLLFRCLSVDSQEVVREDMDHVFSKIDFNSIYYPIKAKEQLDSVKRAFSSEQSLMYNGYLDYIHAQFLYNEMKVDSSLHFVEKAISYFASKEDKIWLSRCQFLLANIAETTGLYEQAKINCYEAIKLGEGLDETIVGVAYLAVARCKMALSEEFESEVIEGVSILKQNKNFEVRMYADFMEQYFRLKELDVPEKLNLLATKYLEKDMYDRAVNVYKLIASSYHSQVQYDSAHVYCDRAIDISEEDDVGHLILPALYQFKGVLYFKQQKYNIADVYFSKSLELYKEYNQSNRMLYTYNYLHQIDIAKSNYRQAYFNLQEYIDLVEKTTSSEKIRMAKVLEINNKVDLMKSQLVQLKVEKKASEFMLYLVLVITVVVLAGVGVYVYLYQKSRKAKIEELNKEFHNLLIGIGEKQLLEHRLIASTHTTEITKRQEPKVFVSNGVEDGDISGNFDSCYMETINLFTGSFPQLTKTEVRYAVMICLKLPIEVISKVQNVQPASIRKAKQRIRAKLNVDDNLGDFLQEFREKQISDLAG